MILERLEALCRRRPTHPAIVSAEARLTYDELMVESRRQTKKISEPVVLAKGRSSETICRWLSAWMVGKPFVTLDPTWPRARQQQLCSLLEPPPTEQLAYLVFTSGSTGGPKLVKVPHTGLLPVLEHQIEVFQIQPESRCLWLLSPAFDASLSDVFTALLAGATLYIDELGSLRERLARHHITHLDLPPALLSAHDSLPPHLKTLVIGGEVCPPNTVRRFAGHHRLLNVYGPSEATICTSISLGTPDWDRALLGQPIPGVEYRIVDDELFVGGDHLATGYHLAPELTNRKFVELDGSRYFRTGDRVRQLDGDYEFLGRTDRQVKIRGCLVALEEVETHLRQAPGVGRAAVGLNGDQLVAQLEGCPLAAERYLRDRLPDFMIPTRFESYRGDGSKSTFVVEPNSLDILKRCAEAQQNGQRLSPSDFFPRLAQDRPCPARRKLRLGPAGRTLLTGGSGFLGSQLRKHLGSCQLYAPSRAEMDLETPFVPPRVDTIIHCAGRTALTLSRWQHDQLNLEGTRRLLELEARFHYISTLAVLVAGPRSGVIDETSSPLSRPHGAYARSKLAAERLVMASGPTWVYRPGLLVGGAPRRDDQFLAFLRGLVRWRCLPDGDFERLRLDLTPVDFAARSIASLAAVAPPGVYHLANRRPLSLAEIVASAQRRGYSIARVPATLWLETVRGDDLFRLSVPRLLGNPDRSLDLFLASEVEFDCSLTESLTGLRCPPPEDLLEACWRDV
ncbi:MAG: AMP-binding protein [Vulcanimicrobiota bacterium]